MPARYGDRRRLGRRVSRRRYLARRMLVTMVLATAVVAVANLFGALTYDGNARAASAVSVDSVDGRVSARRLEALPRAAREVQPVAAVTPPATPSADLGTAPADSKPPAAAALPAGSGSGKRVVYDISAQQVWLVDASDVVARTYRVSGSRYDQLEAGTYQVFSRSRHATSWHGTESMEFMVRFHRGARSNIGFHDIPVHASTGVEVQTLADLGTPLSDGCIRQDVADAAALWEFAPVGTSVVVLR
jgi:lipoprotein-anchoring transpeptidase ErfK/SrfK